MKEFYDRVRTGVDDSLATPLRRQVETLQQQVATLGQQADTLARQVAQLNGHVTDLTQDYRTLAATLRGRSR